MRMPIYSHSRLETYRNCPLQYKFQYIELLERKGEGIEAFLGSRVHETLRKLYDDLLHGKRNSLTELLDYFDGEWEKHWSEEDIRIVRQEYTPEHYRAVGKECIEKYYARYVPFDGDTTLGVETRVNFSLDHEGRYRMQGYIDRLARSKDGVWEIHDYKTSGSLPTQEDVDDQPQLALYQIGLQQKWPQVRRVRLVWHYLRFDMALCSTWAASKLEELRQDTIRLVDKIESAQIFPPQENNLCQWCDFPDRCPLKMHPLKVSTMPPEEFRTDSGVQLVDRYADLKGQEREIRALLEETRERLIAYARREGVGVISGTQQLAAVRLKKKFKFPESGDEKRKLLEDLLRQAGKWDEISSLSNNKLDKILRDQRWDPKLAGKIKQLATEEEEGRVNLRKKKQEK